MGYIFKLISNGISECRLLWGLSAVQQHGVAIAEKAVFLFDGVPVNFADALAAGKGRHQHQQRGFGQVEIGYQAVNHAERVARRDENIRVALTGVQAA